MSQDLNFANQDLRDRSFKGRNLRGANFSGSDIRGCNFCRSQLQSANFANARAGKSPRQELIVKIIAFLLGLAFAGTVMIAMILLLTFAIALFSENKSFDHESVSGVAVTSIVVFAVSFAVTFTANFPLRDIRSLLSAILVSLLVSFTTGFYGSAFTKMLVVGAFNVVINSLKENLVTALLTFVIIEPLQIFGCLYLFSLAISVSKMFSGTKFKYANLTQVSFFQAHLHNCDFSEAITEDVNWEQAKIYHCKLK